MAARKKSSNGKGVFLYNFSSSFILINVGRYDSLCIEEVSSAFPSKKLLHLSSLCFVLYRRT